MDKIDELIKFLKQIPYTERRNMYSCEHMSLECDIEDEYFVRVNDGDTDNYFSIEVETEYFPGGDCDDFGNVEIERREIISVYDVNYFNDNGDMIKIKEATKEQLKIIYSELPVNY